MSTRYFRHFKRMNNWDRVKMWTDKKLITPHKYFWIFKMFDSHSIPLSNHRESTKGEIVPRIKKVLNKYPHLLSVQLESKMSPESIVSNRIDDPIALFLKRQDKYLKQGFTEEKSFELAEKDMSEEIQKEKYERSVFEGLATSNRSRSLMSDYEQQAEFESRQKIKQLERNSEEFKRYQANIDERYADILNQDEEKDENEGNETLEKKIPRMKKYEPVSYRTSNMQDEKDFNDVQKKFSERSEMLLKFYQSFSDIKDGISSLTERDVLVQARETPQKLKDSFNKLTKKLEKYGVMLDDSGNVDYEKIKDKNAIPWIKNNERMVSICLLCKDLDFEIPHKFNQNVIKQKLIEDLRKEEKNLKDLNAKHLADQAERDRLKRKSNNYESYFGILPNYDTDILVEGKKSRAEGADRNMKKYVKFDEFVKDNSNKFMFDNDLLWEQYFYWEDSEEKESRLRELWINSRKIKLERAGRFNDFEVKKIAKLNEDIVDSIRLLRRKIDQTLLKNKKHPIFGSNYRYYKRDEFMMDTEVEFHKIKKFLENAPETIKKDPEIGYKYDQVIELLKRKVIKEDIVIRYGDEASKNYYSGKQQNVDDEENQDDFNVTTAVDNNTSQGVITKKGIELYVRDSVGKTSTTDPKANKEMDKIKTNIVSHFENILKEKGEVVKKDGKGPSYMDKIKKK